jgi:hypothetical protein
MKCRFLIFLLAFLIYTPRVHAIYDPKVKVNNRFGVHVFDVNEIDEASKLVNGNGGAWGYITVPIRSDDKDRKKWNEFMAKCEKNKIIPILRLATTMTNGGWSKPGKFDGIDFANFLNDLNWPIKNRYVIVYNEPNHHDEWGGQVNPEEYADVLFEYINIFKRRNEDFYMLPAGLDIAAPTDHEHLYWKQFLLRMWNRNSQSLIKLDGWNSHAYPNPAFSNSPYAWNEASIKSFVYEGNFVRSLTGKTLDVFITETGWNRNNLNDQTIANYLIYSMDHVWNDFRIIAVTPFVLEAHAGPFAKFAFIDKNGESKQYEIWKNYPKINGEPEYPKDEIIEAQVLGEKTEGEKVQNKFSQIWNFDKIIKNFNKAFEWIK